MPSDLNYKNLKEVIKIAENKLSEIEDTNSKKYKKIDREVQIGYSLIDNIDVTQKNINRQEKRIWDAMQNQNYKFLILFIILGFIFSSVIVYTGYQAYSFIDTILNGNQAINPPGIPGGGKPHKPETNPNLVNLINVNYKETSIVDLKNLNTVSDSEGLQNPSQSFSISNDYKGKENFNYKVKYAINLVELSKDKDKMLNKKYIKYRLSYTDENGKTINEPISSFDKLTKNADGTYLLYLGTQKKNTKTDFKMTIWLSSLADNSEQNKEYLFMYKVNAVIY